MRTQPRSRAASIAVAFLAVGGITAVASAHRHHPRPPSQVQVGVRPYYLVDDMDEGPLKDRLQQCSEQPLRPSQFSIAHRGAPLQFPEETAITPAIHHDGDMYELIDVLARRVAVRGIFSDWPGTVTYYANCMGLGL